MNFREKAKELVAKWDSKSFRFHGHRLQADLYGSDEPEEGEQTIEEKAELDRNYCLVIVKTEFDYFESNDPYVTVEVDEDRFWSDFIDQEIKANFGENIKIRHNENTGEFEITRLK